MKIKSFLKYHIKDRITLFQKRLQLTLWNEKPPILIFTMAKVGSLSIYFSLKKSTSRTTLFHIHHLNQSEVSKNIKLCFDNGVYPGSRSPVPIILSEIINKDRPYQIISLFRDPIERNISAFFEAFEFYVGVPPEKYKGTLPQLESIYHEKLPHHYAINWFDDKLFPSTGINVYDLPFNHKEGVLKFTKGRVSILIMHSAIDDISKAKHIKKFIDAKTIDIQNRNITANSKAADLYSQFKNTTRFDLNYLNNLYQSKYAKHFFTDSQRQNAINKWLKK